MTSLNWKGLEVFFINELKKTNHIQTFGRFGSDDISHDIDLLVTKKPSSPTEKFFMEVHGLLDSTKKFLSEKYNKKLIRFSRFIHEREVLHIGEHEEGDIALHLMTYVSWPQIKDEWKSDLIRGKSFKRILKKKYNPLIGNVDMLFSKEFSKPNKYDNFVKYMYQCDRFHSNYPSEVLVGSMNNLFKYLHKLIGSENHSVVKNEFEAKEKFYDMARMVDRLNKV